MKRYELLNALIDRYQYQTYVEIGVDNPSNCFDRVKAPRKMGVDPFKGTDGPGHMRVSSDEFFTRIPSCFTTIDLFFIDGLHTSSQASKDICNALLYLSPRGTIVVHDCLPKTPEQASDERNGTPQWMGGVWRAVAGLRSRDAFTKVWTVAEDCGMSVIQFGVQYPYTGKYETFDDYLQHRTEMLNIVSLGQLWEELAA